MNKSFNKVYRLSNYTVTPHLMSNVSLEIDLTKKPVQCKALIVFTPNPAASQNVAHIELNGENMLLISLLVNNKKVHADDFEVTDHSLIIKNIPKNEPFTVKTTTLLGENSDLFGLYETEGIYLIKAETEGLRRVFYCHDRPDNQAIYRTVIIAAKDRYPVLLSNGKLIATEDLEHGNHKVTWLDEVPKPSYLFAMVAGSLQRSATCFTTRSGRQLPLEFYVPAHATAQCQFAKEVLKSAMAWDERTFNLECDLKQHMIAGVEKYASGASEPPGLNLFNTINLYASKQTKTDLGMLRVLEVVAHEFFHYWSGNRVTIRDWFNLPFKEGLTTFRTALFREDLFGTDLIRILDGKNREERAPRQNSYTAVRSLYTAAAYEKSADIFRMIMLTIGREHFHKGMMLFFQEYDGQSVTLEDVLHSLTDYSGLNINAFLPWFTESGIPEVRISDEYNSENKSYTLKIKVIGGKSRPIPCVIGLLDCWGNEILSDYTLLIDKPAMEFHFHDISSRPIPSLLRSFSAPVYIKHKVELNELMVLIQYDTNHYNRYEAARTLIIEFLTSRDYDPDSLPSEFFATYRSILYDKTIDPWILARIIALPTEEDLIASLPNTNFEQIIKGLKKIRIAIANELKNDLLNVYGQITNHQYIKPADFSIFDIREAGIRKLRDACYSYFQYTDYNRTKFNLIKRFNEALGHNMPETISALTILTDMNCPEVITLYEEFYNYWKANNQCINYWFNIQASAHHEYVVDIVRSLTQHPAFDLQNPNKVCAVFTPFICNPYGFHQASGKGYQLVAEIIIKLDKINPPLAAHFAQNFVNWKKYDDKRQQLMLEGIALINAESVSIDVKNVVQNELNH